MKKCKNPKCKKAIPHKKRKNIFCNSSCSASYNNTKRIVSNKTKAKMSKSNGNKGKKYYCKHCTKIIDTKRKRIFCSRNCNKLYRRKGKNKYLQYKRDCKFIFNLKDYPNAFNFDLIKEHGWYSPSNSKKPNLKGVSRDHMYSVRQGFEDNISAEHIAHPANCKLMIHTDNISKNKKSSLTYDELLERIKEWDYEKEI